MADVVERERVLERGVFQKISAPEGFVDADLDVFIDCR
jgi:hypothetical protein